MSDAVLSLTGVKKSYNKGLANEVNVLCGCDLTLNAGEVVALVAPSGSGKSTLLHIAGLLSEADEGSVTPADTNLAGQTHSPPTLRGREEGG